MDVAFHKDNQMRMAVRMDKIQKRFKTFMVSEGDDEKDVLKRQKPVRLSHCHNLLCQKKCRGKIPAGKHQQSSPKV
eukprot:4562698-Ditylum_brightwellii.AAC.1